MAGALQARNAIVSSTAADETTGSERRPPVSDAHPYQFTLLPDAGPVAGQWEVSGNLRPIAAAGCCSRCNGATWQHQAHDICGSCGHVTQHEIPEVRLLMKSA
jgi:hypothetical protein